MTRSTQAGSRARALPASFIQGSWVIDLSLRDDNGKRQTPLLKLDCHASSTSNCADVALLDPGSTTHPTGKYQDPTSRYPCYLQAPTEQVGFQHFCALHWYWRPHRA